MDQPALFEETTKAGKPFSERSRLLRIRDFYVEKIRRHDPSQLRGVIRQMEGLLKKGMTVDQLWAAVKNYEADEFRKRSDARLVKHIRTFFTPDVIQEWQQPVATRSKSQAKDPSLEALDRLREFTALKPVLIPRAPLMPEPPDEEEERTL